MTPIIIKETLGEEVYKQFEELRLDSQKHNRSIHILTSAKGKEQLEKALEKNVSVLVILKT